MILDMQGTSLVNYPKHVASVIFLAGCNLHCPYCYNRSLVYPERDAKQMPMDEIVRRLTERKDFITGVCITGGEPTINQSELLELIDAIKSVKADLDIKLDTNGTLPCAVEEVIKRGGVSYIAMDYKTAPEDYKGVFCKYDVSDAIKESMKIIRASFDSDHYEFRTTIAMDFFSREVAERMAEHIEAKDTLYFQNFRYVGEEFHVNTRAFDDIMNASFSRKGAEHAIEPFRSKTDRIFFRNF